MDMSDTRTASGVSTRRIENGVPDEHGVLDTSPVRVPPYRAAVFFAADNRGPKSAWPADANRELPWVVGSNLGELFDATEPRNRAVGEPNRLGLAVLLQQRDGPVTALLSVPGASTLSVFRVDEDGSLSLRLLTLGTAAVTAEAPLYAWGHAETAASAFRSAWRAALEHPVVESHTGRRWEKPYPEPFGYLGWCSWEHFKKNIDEGSMARAVRELSQCSVPVRWVLIDDGHQLQAEGRLKSLSPDPQKFPRGFKPITDLRSNRAIRWLGLWHAFQGLWQTVDTENEMAELDRYLVRLPSGGYLPRGDVESAEAFYDALIGSAAGADFDFVKIDVQAANLAWYRGSENAVVSSANNSRALENAVERRMRHGMINCMAHNALCLFNTRRSAVTRCSIDYHTNDPASSASHILQSYTNTLWLGWSVWPDHDMFHSSDKSCGRMMAVSKALSGAPVYLSDAPDEIAASLVAPLCTEDGRLFRPLAPAAPLPDSVFLDALNDPSRAYSVIAPLPGECAAVAAYNLVQKPVKITSTISAEVYRHAGMMMQHDTPWELPNEGLVAYDWYAGTARRLSATDSIEVRLDFLQDALIILCPIVEGWAVVGRRDKYLAPAAVTAIQRTESSIRVSLVEGGPLLVWSSRGEPTAPGASVTHIADELYQVAALDDSLEIECHRG